MPCWPCSPRRPQWPAPCRAPGRSLSPQRHRYSLRLRRPRRQRPQLRPRRNQALRRSPSTAPQIEDAGLIRAEQFRHGRGEGSISLSAGSIRNSTACADADLRAAVTTANLPFAVELNSDEPQVLILHTHATETYQTWPDLLYDRSAAARTRNTALNMCAVGARMAEVLNAAGIHTLHDETLHDSPSYTESYDRSRATAQEYLRQYPSIKVVLDVHRDAIEDADGTLVKPVCTIDGASTAQVMIIAGVRQRQHHQPAQLAAEPALCRRLGGSHGEPLSRPDAAGVVRLPVLQPGFDHRQFADRDRRPRKYAGGGPPGRGIRCAGVGGAAGRAAAVKISSLLFLQH